VRYCPSLFSPPLVPLVLNKMGRGGGHTKVFVGNLSFKTKEADLASEFSSAGKVVSANIITRGPRSLGYGFVEFETEDDAKRAVELMNKKTIDNREINVEVARPRDETKLAERRRGRRGGGRPRGAGRGGNPRGGASGGANFTGRRGRYRPRNQSDSGSGPAAASTNASGAPSSNGASSAQSSAPRRGRGGAGPRGFGRQNNAPRTPSKTTLFVANLPFALDDNGLNDLFKDLKVTKAHVVKNRNGRSKGFGFVEFGNEDDQKSALTAAEKFEVDTRKLIVKIALTDGRREGAAEQHESGNEKETPLEKKEESAK